MIGTRTKTPFPFARWLASFGLAACLPVVGASAVAGCGAAKPPEPAQIPEPEDSGAPEPEDAAPPAPKTLWEKLGGKEGVAAVVDLLLSNAFDDNRFGKLFDKSKKGASAAANRAQLAAAMVAFVCTITGGGNTTDCGYTGKPMKEAHQSMKITPAQWDAFKEDLDAALMEKKIDDDTRKELGAKLDLLRADIVVEKKK